MPTLPAHSYARIIAVQRAKEYLPLLRRGELFSHTTALFLLGAPIEADPRPHVTIHLPAAAAHGATVRGHRTRVSLEHHDSPDGLPYVGPLRALMQVAAMLPPRELVIAIDHLIRPGGFSPHVGPALGVEAIWAHARAGGFAGSQRLRTALSLSRVGAESRMETLTRLLLLEAGYPEPDLQVNIADSQGAWIGRFDLSMPGLRKLIEYDGDQHRTDRKQYARDQARIRSATLSGYEVLRLTASDLQPGSWRATRALFREFLGVPPKNVPRRTAEFLAAGTGQRR